MKKLAELTALQLVKRIKAQELKAEEYISFILSKIEKEKELNAFVTVNREGALTQAKELDKRLRMGEKVGRLCGVALAIKDNICTQGIRTTCASKMLKNFVPPYDATVVERLKRHDVIIVGKTNMDEFAMGSSTEFTIFGPTKNPWDPRRVAGGSSGGSAVAVAAKEATIALGSDTGGSIRCPAAFCSVVGLKPTYGLVSRYGLISYGNSLEQIGPITRDVSDCALLLSCIAGHDERDSTSVPEPPKDYTKYLTVMKKRFKVGIPSQLLGDGVQEGVKKVVWKGLELLKEAGGEYEEFSWEHLDSTLAAYYIIAMAEASSNLARFDGLRYGFSSYAGRDWSTAFSRTRRLGFGPEVKRRIILGTYALSAGYYEQYYVKAQKVRTFVRRLLDKVFKKFDVIASPTMPVLPFFIGEKIKDPLELYMCDVATVPANLTGFPAISVPCGFYDGLPVGLQLMAPPFREDFLIQVAYTFEQLRSKSEL